MILAGILQLLVYSINECTEADASGIGTIAANEITHSFDNNGAKYNTDGNFAK